MQGTNYTNRIKFLDRLSRNRGQLDQKQAIRRILKEIIQENGYRDDSSIVRLPKNELFFRLVEDNATVFLNKFGIKNITQENMNEVKEIIKDGGDKDNSIEFSEKGITINLKHKTFDNTAYRSCYSFYIDEKGDYIASKKMNYIPDCSKNEEYWYNTTEKVYNNAGLQKELNVARNRHYKKIEGEENPTEGYSIRRSLGSIYDVFSLNYSSYPSGVSIDEDGRISFENPDCKPDIDEDIILPEGFDPCFIPDEGDLKKEIEKAVLKREDKKNDTENNKPEIKKKKQLSTPAIIRRIIESGPDFIKIGKQMAWNMYFDEICK